MEQHSHEQSVTPPIAAKLQAVSNIQRIRIPFFFRGALTETVSQCENVLPFEIIAIESWFECGGGFFNYLQQQDAHKT